jgi:pimeloyl-ACP methyl ester carboxylesterase
MTTTIRSTVDRYVAVNGTALYTELRGVGPRMLVIHGGGEDAGMLAPQAERLAVEGYAVATYDRRGTRRSGREDWPGAGAVQHADDATALVRALDWRAPIVVGVSSGAVIALELASRHPGAVGPVIAWEPPAVGIIPDGAETAAALMAPVDAHLSARPDDFVGAQALLLSSVLGYPVGVDDPAFADARANAEPFVRDEPVITTAPLHRGLLAAADITIAVGSTPNDVVAATVDILSDWTGRPPVRVDADHEVYLTDPTVLTGIVNDVQASAKSGSW